MEAAGLWECLKDVEIYRGYNWRKEYREPNNCIVCYAGAKEIGFIPIQCSKFDVEWINWWDAAYKRLPHITLGLLMDEIIDRYERYKKKQR